MSLRAVLGFEWWDKAGFAKFNNEGLKRLNQGFVVHYCLGLRRKFGLVRLQSSGSSRKAPIGFYTASAGLHNRLRIRTSIAVFCPLSGRAYYKRELELQRTWSTLIGANLRLSLLGCRFVVCFLYVFRRGEVTLKRARLVWKFQTYLALWLNIMIFLEQGVRLVPSRLH